MVVYSGDGDLFAIGGNHFIHAARRNMDLMVVCVNNFTYGMTGGQVAPTTPLGPTQTTMPYGNFENPFNLPFLADACGAVYVARWTVFHVRQLAKAMKEGLAQEGLRLHRGDVPLPDALLAPQPARRRRRPAEVLQGKERSSRTAPTPRRSGSTFQGEIIVGKFVDRERPTWLDSMNEHFAKVLGDKYTPYGADRWPRLRFASAASAGRA